MKTKAKKIPADKSKSKISKRLCAAAPDLLSACWSILITCEELELGDIEVLNDVRHAISRATGKPVRKRHI